MSHKKNEAMKRKRTRYKAENRMTHNKIKKLKRTIKQQPNNQLAKKALENTLAKMK